MNVVLQPEYIHSLTETKRRTIEQNKWPRDLRKSEKRQTSDVDRNLKIPYPTYAFCLESRTQERRVKKKEAAGGSSC
jgi:hypothetical protein